MGEGFFNFGGPRVLAGASKSAKIGPFFDLLYE